MSKVDIIETPWGFCEIDPDYEPRYYMIQVLECTECGWVADFEQVIVDCGVGDGDLVDGPEKFSNCPKCGGSDFSGNMKMFWTDEAIGVCFIWGEKAI